MQHKVLAFCLVLAAVGICPEAATAQIAQRAVYHFDNATANDSSPYANNGTVVGATFTGGKLNRFHSGLALDGVSDYVSVPDSASLDITGSLTVEGWVMLAAYPSEFAPIASKWNDIPFGTDNRGYFLAVLPNGRVRFDVSHTGLFAGTGCTGTALSFACSESALVISTTVIPLDTWAHVAGVFDSATRRLQVFVNGVPDTMITATRSDIFANDEPLLIGAGDLGSNVRDFFSGVLDEARVWGRALNNNEIAASAAMGYLSSGTPGSDQIKDQIYGAPPPDGDMAVFTSHFLTPGDVRISIATSLETTVITAVEIEDVRFGAASCGGVGNACLIVLSNGDKTATLALVPLGNPKSARLRVTLSTGNTFAVNVAF